MLDHGLDLTPSMVLSDFERALINALWYFPMAEHRISNRLNVDLCFVSAECLEVARLQQV